MKFVLFPLELVVNTGWLPGQLEDRVLPSPDYTVLGISSGLPDSRVAVLLLEHLSPLTPGYEQLPKKRTFSIYLPLTVASLWALGEVHRRFESGNRRQRSLSSNGG